MKKTETDKQARSKIKEALQESIEKLNRLSNENYVNKHQAVVAKIDNKWRWQKEISRVMIMLINGF